MLLADNDITWKLYICGIFDEVIALYGCARTDVRVLESAKYVIGNRAGAKSKARKSLVHLVGEDGTKNFGAFLETLSASPSPSPSTDELLVSIFIDPGEAQLLRVAYEDRSATFVTGDRRCLQVLSSTPACETLRTAVVGRIACFESILLELIDLHGFEWVRDRVAPVHEKDGTLRLVFSGGTAARETNVIEGLRSYSRDFVSLFRAQAQALY